MKSSYLSPLLAPALALFVPYFSAAAKTPLPLFTGTCDQPTGIYGTGQKVTLTVHRGEGATAPATVKVLRNNSEPILTEEMPAGEQTRTITFTAPTDDWHVCSVSVPGEKKPWEVVGVVFDPQNYKPSAPAPEDFDAFWSEQKARLAAEKAVAKVEPLTAEQRAREESNPENQKRIRELEAEGYTGSNLEISCLDLKPVRAYIAQPKNAGKGGHPVIMYFRAAGVDGEWCRSSYVNALSLAKKFNAIVIDMNAHGMLNGQPQEYYSALAKGELAGYQTQGRNSRDTFYFRGMFLRLIRALDYAAALPEWDGKHLVCMGTSQGGAQALAAAGLDSRVSAVVATVPANCDITASLAKRPSSWPGIGDGKLEDEETKKILNTVRYFDNVNFCARSKAQTLITVGFVDLTCPAPGIYAAYNQLQGEKRIITAPEGSHKSLSALPKEIQAQYDTFIAKHITD